MDYVTNIDIENFFGSIEVSDVQTLLIRNGMSEVSAALVARLVTKDGVLPQGAPTSPAISNLCLVEFDQIMLTDCQRQNLRYSRYADDITISGADRDAVVAMIQVARERLLGEYGLRLNEDKTRIASRHGQQKVTGLVVNEKALPPRKFRRRVRAAFHNAYKQDRIDIDCYRHLVGYLSYLKSFAELRGTLELTEYERILQGLRHAAS